MFLSLIVYVHNTEKYLKKCLDSVKSQDFDDYEIIVVDDGSTDGSAAICDEFAKECGKAKVIHRANEGLSAARNCGIDAANSEWLWFINGSDSITDGAVSAINERMSLGMGELYTMQYIETDEKGENSERIILRENQETAVIKNDGDLRWNLSDRLLNGKDGAGLFLRVVNRNIVKENNLRFLELGDAFSEEVCFLSEYMMYVNKAVFLVNFLYVHRDGVGSESKVQDQKAAIPALIRALETIYKKAKALKKNQVVKEFFLLCKGGLGYQIQNSLVGLSDDEIIGGINAGTGNSLIGKYIKSVKKELITAVQADRVRKQ